MNELTFYSIPGKHKVIDHSTEWFMNLNHSGSAKLLHKEHIKGQWAIDVSTLMDSECKLLEEKKQVTWDVNINQLQ